MVWIMHRAKHFAPCEVACVWDVAGCCQDVRLHAAARHALGLNWWNTFGRIDAELGVFGLQYGLAG